MADRTRRVDGSTDTEVRPAEQPAIEEPRTGRLRFPSARAVGAFITTTMQTGAIDVGIRRLAIPIGSRPLAPERDAPAIVVGTRVRNPVRELLVDSTAREAIPHGGSVTVVTQRRVQEPEEEEGEDEGAA